MKNKVAIFGIIVQLAGLIYGIVNKAEDIIVMCLIFMFISTVALFDKKKKWKLEIHLVLIKVVGINSLKNQFEYNLIVFCF